MSATRPPSAAPAGTLAANIVHFARALRTAGVPVGPGRVLDALHAITRIDIGDRQELYWALHALLVSDRRHHEIFDQAFTLFFRAPAGMEQVLAGLSPVVPASPPPGRQLSRRVLDAFMPRLHGKSPQAQREIQVDAAMTWSELEVVRHKDFAQMTARELHEAKRAIQRMRLLLEPVPTRRYQPNARGQRVDLRATLRASLRMGGDCLVLHRRSVRERVPPLVVLCDISGSMERYAQMLMHFAHALTRARGRVHTFVFGTRLTNATRYLRYRDVDMALAQVGRVASDWSGGTRIGACIMEFNQRWSRRVLGQGAVVLLITDGLERDAGEGLAAAVERLHKSSRRLIWLNPLLRYDQFEPRAQGIRAMLPHVDEFRPAHDLSSLAELAALLRG